MSDGEGPPACSAGLAKLLSISRMIDSASPTMATPSPGQDKLSMQVGVLSSKIAPARCTPSRNLRSLPSVVESTDQSHVRRAGGSSQFD
jgi:hypothetical protein